MHHVGRPLREVLTTNVAYKRFLAGVRSHMSSDFGRVPNDKAAILTGFCLKHNNLVHSNYCGRNNNWIPPRGIIINYKVV